MAVNNSPRQDIPARDPEERNKDFKEVSLGLTEEQAVREAQRCIACKKKPCCNGCPVEIDIPEFIKLIAKKDYKGAIRKIKEKNNLPAVCGRVCPQETQCEALCVLIGKGKGGPVAIGALEGFVADLEAGHPEWKAAAVAKEKKNIKVAVAGSGPAGLTAAADLAKYGYQVTLLNR